MISSSQIRDQLALYLDNRTDLASFQDWFIENSWNVHQSGSQATESLAFAVQELLADYSSGYLKPKQLRAELNRVVHADTRLVELAETYAVPFMTATAPLFSAVAYVRS